MAVTTAAASLSSAMGGTGTTMLAGGALMGAAALEGRRGAHGPGPATHTASGPNLHADTHAHGGASPNASGAHAPKAETSANTKPPAAPAASWHEVLGVGPDASKSEIDRAFRKQSRQHHPDKGGDVNKQAELVNARDEAIQSLEKRAQAKAGDDAAPKAKPGGEDTAPSRNGEFTDAAADGASYALTQIGGGGSVVGANQMASIAAAQGASTAAQNAVALIKERMALSQALSNFSGDPGKGSKAAAS
jgi:hypothetical protein